MNPASVRVFYCVETMKNESIFYKSVAGDILANPKADALTQRDRDFLDSLLRSKQTNLTPRQLAWLSSLQSSTNTKTKIDKPTAEKMKTARIKRRQGDNKGKYRA